MGAIGMRAEAEEAAGWAVEVPTVGWLVPAAAAEAPVPEPGWFEPEGWLGFISPEESSTSKTIDSLLESAVAS